MGNSPSVQLRGKRWLIGADQYSIHYLQASGDPKTTLRYPTDLSPTEVNIVVEAWRLELAEKQRKQKERDALLKRWRKEERELMAAGGAWIREEVWHVEWDHVWRDAGTYSKTEKKWVANRVELKFSELTSGELAKVMEAKEREVLNRGIGGFLRRIGRKYDEWEQSA